MRAGVIVVAAVMASACGCVFGLGGGKKDEREPPAREVTTPPMPPDDRIAPGWQDHVEALAKTLPTGSDVYALFSEGGWADAGQVVVIASGGPRRLITTASGAKPGTYAQDRALTEAEWQTLQPVIARAATLADVNTPVFDALVFEYVHILADANARGPQKRVVIRHAGTTPIPAHDALIKAFQDLRGRIP